MVQSPHLLTQCPVCQTSYQKEEIRLLGEQGTTKLFHCSCQKCHHSVLLIVLENTGWMSSIGLVTDLEMKDVLQVRTQSPISVDECVRFHRFLEKDGRELSQALLQHEA